MSMPSVSYTKFGKVLNKFMDDYTKELFEKVSQSLELSDDQKSKMETECKFTCEPKNSHSSCKKDSMKPKVKRAPTKYNLFIQKKIMELKNSNPDIDRKELMKMAAKAWSEEKIKNSAEEA